MTESLESKYTFVWSIENFSLCPQARTECILSPVFSVEILDYAQFYLSLYPRGKTQGGFIYCDFSRNDYDRGPEVVEFDLTLSIQVNNDLKGTIYRSCKAKRNRCLTSGFETHINSLFDNRKEFLPNDTLTFQCSLIPKFSVMKSSKRCYADTIVRLEKHSFDLPWISTQFPVATTAHASPQDCFFNVPLQCHSEHGKFEIEIRNCLDLSDEGRIKIRRTETNGSKKKLLVNFKAFFEDIYLIVWVALILEPGKSEWEIPFSANMSLTEPVSEDRFSIRWDFAISDGRYTTTSIRTLHESLKGVCYQDPYFRHEMKEKSIWKAIYGDKKFCDVTLRVENTNYLAHKCVLFACSPVFSAMLENDMKEKETGVIEIKDMTKETVQQLLQFIYTGSVVDLQQNNVADLYVVADKYQILQLRKFCSAFLKANMTVDNICDILEIANLFRDSDLERKARSYIRAHTNYIFNSNEWKSFMEKQIQLAADIMLDLCKNVKVD